MNVVQPLVLQYMRPAADVVRRRRRRAAAARPLIVAVMERESILW
jgi:hypothetical protein